MEECGGPTRVPCGSWPHGPARGGPGRAGALLPGSLGSGPWASCGTSFPLVPRWVQRVGPGAVGQRTLGGHGASPEASPAPYQELGCIWNLGHPVVLICAAWRKQGLCPDSLGTEEWLGPASGLRPGGCWAPAQGQLGLGLHGAGGTRGAWERKEGPHGGVRGAASPCRAPGGKRTGSWSGRCTPHSSGDPGSALNPPPQPLPVPPAGWVALAPCHGHLGLRLCRLQLWTRFLAGGGKAASPLLAPPHRCPCLLRPSQWVSGCLDPEPGPELAGLRPRPVVCACVCTSSLGVVGGC